jgi:hypothetical protein
MEENCPNAWHGGLPAGLLVECIYEPKHRGWHRDGKGLSWGGKLTDAERELANQLRRKAAA